MGLTEGLFGLVLSALGPLTVLVAYWLVTDLARRRADAEGLPPEAVADAGTWLGGGALVVGWPVYVAPDWPTFVLYPLDLVRVQDGVSFYGALVGGLVVLPWYARRALRADVLSSGDDLVLGAPGGLGDRAPGDGRDAAAAHLAAVGRAARPCPSARAATGVTSTGPVGLGPVEPRRRCL